MKRILFTLIAFLCLTAQALGGDLSECTQLARMNGYIAGAGGAAACTTANDTAIFDYTGSGTNSNPYMAFNNAVGGSGFWIGQQFTLAATTTITEYALDVKYNTQQGDIICSIYNDNAGAVGTVIADTSATFSGASITTTLANYKAALGTPKAGVAAGTYWIACASNNASGNYQTQTNTTAGNAYVGSGSYVSNLQIRIGVSGCQ